MPPVTTTRAHLTPCRPDYAGGGLLNLMQTLERCLHATPSEFSYSELDPKYGLTPQTLADVRHVMLVVIDGLGDRQLNQLIPDGCLAQHRTGTLSSVFPSTTASAIPTFLSGLAPQQHGLAGWHMLDEISGQVISTLPLTLRDRSAKQISSSTLARRFISYPPLMKRLRGSCCTISPESIAGSAFNQRHAVSGPTLAYQDINGFAQALDTAIAYQNLRLTAETSHPAYTYAYFPQIDSLMHTLGTTHPRVVETAQALDAVFAQLIDNQRNRDEGLLLAITADHGFIDAPLDRLIELEAGGANEDLLECLRLPLCGERRIAFAYVKEAEKKRFRKILETRFGDACECLDSDAFLANGWLGPGIANPALRGRLGDFALLMKEDWTIKDWLPGERRYLQLGVHGGCSHAEMTVPLIISQG